MPNKILNLLHIHGNFASQFRNSGRRTSKLYERWRCEIVQQSTNVSQECLKNVRGITNTFQLRKRRKEFVPLKSSSKDVKNRKMIKKWPCIRNWRDISEVDFMYSMFSKKVGVTVNTSGCVFTRKKERNDIKDSIK